MADHSPSESIDNKFPYDPELNLIGYAMEYAIGFDPSPSVAKKFFYVPGLMEYAMNFANIQTIIAVGKSCQRGRDYMQATLASLIRVMLRPFLPEVGE